MSQAVIYRRQSLDKAGDELGIARQLSECERVATQRGIEVHEVITDNSFSASKRGRPGYDRLVKAVSNGAVNTIIILRIDRLLRLNDELEELIQLVEQHNLRVITCEGEIDLTTPQGRLIARILVSVARSEMEIKGARHRLANDQRAKAGLPHAGRRAYGYELDGMTLREDEALVLKELAQRFLNGWTYTQLADWLNECGYTTTMGNKFYSVAIRQLLQRKRYIGVREHDGIEYEAQWPAIFDLDTWARIQHRIKERSASIGFRPMPRRHLLTGLIFCGACGAPMNGTTTYDRKTGLPRKTYRCNRNRVASNGGSGCGKVSRGSVPMEWLIQSMICHRLDSPDLGRLLETHKSSADLLSRQEALETRLTELLDDYTDQTLSKAEYKRARERTQHQLNAVRRDLDRLHYDRTLNGLVMAGESVKMRWEAESEGWRRQLIDLLIERITVNPTRKLPRIKIEGKLYYFDAEAVDVVWRV